MVSTVINILLALLVPPGSASSGGAIKPQLDLRLGNNAQLIAFSPDSKTAATASHDGTIILWNTRTCEIIHTILLPNRENARSICFSYDGGTLASASNNLDNNDGNSSASSHACLWDSGTGNLIRTLNDKTWAMGLECSPTKDLVAVREESMTSLAREPGSVLRIYVGTTGKLASSIPLQNHLIDAMAFSHDGSQFAVVDAVPDSSGLGRIGGRASTIILWNAGASAEIGRIKSPNGPFYSILFAPDGHSLAAIGANGDRTAIIQIWDTHSLELKRTLSIKDTIIDNYAFSPDGTKIAAGHISSKDRNDRFEVIWDVARGISLLRIPTRSFNSSLCFSGDGSRLYTSIGSLVGKQGGNAWWTGVPASGIAVWSVATGKRIKIVGDRDAIAWYFALSPDGSTLLGTGPGVRFFDAQTLRMKSYAPAAMHVPMALRISQNGSSLAIIRDGSGQCNVLYLNSGRLTSSFGAVNEYKSDLAFSQNGDTAWTLGVTYKLDAPPERPVNMGVIEEYDIGAKRIRRTVIPPVLPPTPAPQGGTPVSSLLFSPTERDLLIVGGGGRRPNDDTRDRAGLGAAESLRTKWDANQLYGLRDNAADGITWWRDGERINRAANAVTGNVYGLAISPDGKTLASGGQYETIFWHADTGVQISRFHTRYFGGAPSIGYVNAAIRPMAFSPDGSMLACGDYYAVRFYSSTGGQWHEVVTLPEQIEPTEARSVQVYSGGTEILAIPEQTEPVRDLAFSPNGLLLATAGQDGTARIWDVKTGKEQMSLVHGEPVRSVIWRGRALITGCEDGKIRFWKADTGELALTVMMFSDVNNSKRPTWFAYTPAGMYDGSNDVGRILRWRVNSQTYPARKFQKMMHRPNLIARTLAEL